MVQGLLAQPCDRHVLGMVLCIPAPLPPSPPALHGTQQVSREALGPAGSDICFVTYAVVTKKP